MLQVEALKALSIKLINTATFVYQLYRIQINSTGDTTVSISNTSNLQARAYLPDVMWLKCKYSAPSTGCTACSIILFPCL